MVRTKLLSSIVQTKAFLLFFVIFWSPFFGDEEFAMAEETNRSSPGGTEEGNSKPPREEEGGAGNQTGEFDDDAQRRVSVANSSDCTAERTCSGEKRGESKSETLTSVRVSESGFESSCKESSEFLSEVPVEYSLQPLPSGEEIKDDVRAVYKEPLEGGQTRGPSILELPKGANQSISATSKKELQPVDDGNSIYPTVQDKQNFTDPKLLSTVALLKTPDGYNWRKYGQKQVKSPEGSRSYYRCTFSNCHAKKIECCDRSNHAIEIVYKNHHNHDPPQKVKCIKENRSPSTLVPVNGSHETTNARRGLNDSVSSTPSKESLVVSDTKRQDSCGSDETTEINVKEEFVEGPEHKRRKILRQKKSSGEPGSLTQPGKKPKYVVHAAGDVAISSDGYRWRKYGQKMVKGNPHPRNYYRCTSAGCPVRKQIERDADNASASLITYKGAHNHDMPVPRKRHGSKSSPLPVHTAAIPITMVDQQGTESQPHQCAKQQPVDKQGELKPSGGKSLEPTRTLLSIGFEIKPC